MKVLITGANGFIGSRLCFLLQEKGHCVAALDPIDLNNDDGSFLQKSIFLFRQNLVRGVRLFQGLSTDKKLVKSIFDEFQPEVVFHLGMISSAKEAEADLAWARQSIVEGTRTLLLSISKQPKKAKFIFASSSMVYGHFTQDRIDEKHQLLPVNQYGVLKKEAEILIEGFCRENQIPFTIARPISVFGPGDDIRRVTSKMIVDALIKKQITLSNPELKTDFTFVDEVAECLYRIGFSEKANSQKYNLSSGCAVSLIQLATTIGCYLSDVQIIVSENHEKPVSRGALENKKAFIDLGFRPQKDFQDGILETVNYFKDLMA